MFECGARSGKIGTDRITALSVVPYRPPCARRAFGEPNWHKDVKCEQVVQYVVVRTVQRVQLLGSTITSLQVGTTVQSVCTISTKGHYFFLK